MSVGRPGAKGAIAISHVQLLLVLDVNHLLEPRGGVSNVQLHGRARGNVRVLIGGSVALVGAQLQLGTALALAFIVAQA
jgi:hypothetical protein